jgi:pimeloyl-ACP methyl ester carboxylesterase
MSATAVDKPQVKGTNRPALPASKTMVVHSADGTRLHTEVFGPTHGYPIVLAHGITCALQVWHEQINDLSRDFRVIAYDHRGHGRSGVPAPSAYSLDHLAADLDAVLGAVLRPGERAVVAGHSMGGIAISAWSDRFRDRVEQRADAVALINTTHGNLLDKIQVLKMPGLLRSTRNAAAATMIRSLGAAPLVLGTQPGSRRFLQMMAVGADADPAISRLLHDVFAATAPAGRGAWARALVDELGPREYIDLSGLTVPTLVVGSAKDRLLPICRSRKIADAAPNLIDLVELPGGHCAMLEHPEAVNRQLRGLVGAVAAAQRISS